MQKLLRVLILLMVLAAAAVCLWSLRPAEEPETPPVADPPVTDTPVTPDEPATPDPSDGMADDPGLSDAPAADAPGTVTDDPADELPIGKLVITPARRDYVDGTLTLTIPKLEVSRLVYSGTGADQLRMGIGLFDYAQLPGEGNRNVSLAGHRNGRSNGVVNDHAPFYYIDTLGEGDYLYLFDEQNIYRYIYTLTDIVDADDWSYIRTTGDSVLTLVSCHPIGVSDRRIIVRAALDEIVPYRDDYAFPAVKEELS